MSRRHDLEDEDIQEESATGHTRALKSIQNRRRSQNVVVTMVAVSALMVVLWAATGAGYFWPGWVMGAFALATILRYLRHQRGPITKEQIDEETRRMQSQR